MARSRKRCDNRTVDWSRSNHSATATPHSKNQRSTFTASPGRAVRYDRCRLRDVISIFGDDLAHMTEPARFEITLLGSIFSPVATGITSSNSVGSPMAARQKTHASARCIRQSLALHRANALWPSLDRPRRALFPTLSAPEASSSAGRMRVFAAPSCRPSTTGNFLEHCLKGSVFCPLANPRSVGVGHRVAALAPLTGLHLTIVQVLARSRNHLAHHLEHGFLAVEASPLLSTHRF